MDFPPTLPRSLNWSGGGRFDGVFLTQTNERQGFLASSSLPQCRYSNWTWMVMHSANLFYAALSWSFGFDTNGQLRAGLFISLLSVWLLVGVFTYLNLYTRRKYFSIWTVAWLFYALYLTISYSLYWYYGVFGKGPWWTTMIQQWCISIAAVFMLWGSLRFLGKTVRRVTLGLFLCFLVVWSFVANCPGPDGGSFDGRDRFSLEIPIFSLIGLSSLVTVWGFFQYRRKRQYMGAGLLCFGFMMWGLFVAAYPFMEELGDYMSTGFFIASVLQMFIAVNMIILVLEQLRYLREKRAAQQLKSKEREKAVLRTRISLTEDRYRKLFEQSSEPIVITATDDLAIVGMNAAATRIMGLAKDEHFHGSLIDWFVASPDPDSSRPAGEIWFETICGQRFQQLRRKDGGLVPVEVVGSTIDFAGESTFQFYIREVTERSQLEQHLIQAEKLSGLGQMMSGVAHEVMSPLTGVICHSEVALLDPTLSPEVRNHLEQTMKEGQRAARLLRNFLNLARQGGHEKQLVDLNEVIHTVMELRKGDFLSAEVEAQLNLAAELPPILANLDRIQQVLIILINNAMQAMDYCQRNRTLCITTAANADLVQISVEDSGPGVPEHLQAKVFEPFFTTKPAGVGTGLGLSLARTFLVEHQGRILYRPSRLGGAGFIVELPLHAPRATSSDLSPERAQPSLAESGKPGVEHDEVAVAIP